PPFLAAMMILRAILLQILPRLASVAPLARLIFDQWECPAISHLRFAICDLRLKGIGNFKSQIANCKSAISLVLRLSRRLVGHRGDVHPLAGLGLLDLLVQL